MLASPQKRIKADEQQVQVLQQNIAQLQEQQNARDAAAAKQIATLSTLVSRHIYMTLNTVAVVSEMRLLDLKLLEVGSGEGDLAKALGVHSAQANNPSARSVLTNGLDAHRLAEKRACYDLSFNQWQRLDFCGGFRHPDYSLNTLAQSNPVVLLGSKLACSSLSSGLYNGLRVIDRDQCPPSKSTTARCCLFCQQG
jgi:hypothetical protein